ncbi:MAG TPA: ABC transporter permease [Bryobacteraceae bacterium]|nr:ABC transporter permease [Bryobacteraceae bacterium]
MHTLLQDLRYSLRQLIQNPGFTLTAVISLGLGIGATTAVFSVVYAALLNPYPYPAADRIVRLVGTSKSGAPLWLDIDGQQVRQLRDLKLVESMFAMDYHALNLTGGELPENVNAIGLVGNCFNDLGMPAMLGRGLVPSDASDGQDPQPVVVLSYRYWQKHFLGDPEVLGKSLQMDRKNYIIVGVAAPRFTWYSGDVYIPQKLTRDPGQSFIVDLRLKPGVAHEQADAALQVTLEQFAREDPKRFPEGFKVRVEGLNEWVVNGVGGTLYLLFGAVATLLAIGCGNVSILLLARGTAREHELAVRAAVGAGRSRIIRQLLTESLLLALVGAALGVAMAYGILAGIRVLLPPRAFAPEVVVRISIPALMFSVAVALTTGIAFGLWPALRLSRVQIGNMVKAGTRRVAGSVHGRRTHNALIAGQIGLTLLLLAAAGSAVEGFIRMLHAPLGYDPHNVMSVGIPVREGSYATWAARAAYFAQLRAKVAEAPGVSVAAISSNATPPRNGSSMNFEILGQPGLETQIASVNLVSPEYFSLLRIPQRQGQIWNETETHNGAHVAVINETLARLYFPKGDAIGHSLKLPKLENRPPITLTAAGVDSAWLAIVGVVGDYRDDGLRKPIKPAIFVPYSLNMWPATQILVRSQVSPLTLLRAVRQQLSSINPEQQTSSNVEELETWITGQPEWQQEHLVSWIFSVFAALALALAAVGLYSVVSYTVAQRTNEFGIRLALGAQRDHVLRIVLSSTLVSVGGGIAAGLFLTLVLNSILAKWVEGNSRDPVILVAGTLVLTLVAGMACALPARHAAGIDPMTALRSE